MFAVGYVKNDTLTIVRDRHGETPIHYSLLQNSLFTHFAFCSEIKGLKKLGYQNIQMLPPGSFIKYNSDNSVVKGVWYDIRQNIKRNIFKDRPSASNKLKDLVRQGTLERTLSAVPVCSLNSGGIDSSVIAQSLSYHNAYCLRSSIFRIIECISSETLIFLSLDETNFGKFPDYLRIFLGSP